MEYEKEQVIMKLKKKGCRITKQRKILMDIILESRCSSCKEIYIQASRIDNRIGMSAVYRMVKELEAIGVLSREIIYRD